MLMLTCSLRTAVVICVLPLRGKFYWQINFVCENEFPSRQSAEYVAKHHSDPPEIESRKSMIIATK